MAVQLMQVPHMQGPGVLIQSIPMLHSFGHCSLLFQLLCK